MTRDEYERLKGYDMARKHAPRRIGAVPSRRTSKSGGSHLGQGACKGYNAVPKVFPVMTPSSKL